MTQRLAEKLGVADKDTIRLTAHNLYTHAPMPKPVRFRQPDSLAELMTQHSQTADTLYYEVLDIPVGELEKLKVMKVAFNNSKAEEVGTFTVRVPRDQTVAEALEELRKQLLADPAKPLLSNPAAELRMFEMYFNRIYKTFAAADKVDGIIDSYWQLRAEEVPEEEREVKAGERLLHCTHFHQVAGPGGPQVVNFGDPFLLKIGEEETLGSVRRRVQAKLGVADEEFGKWKIAAVGTTGNKVEYLTDDGEAVAARVIRRDGCARPRPSTPPALLARATRDRSPGSPMRARSLSRLLSQSIRTTCTWGWSTRTSTQKGARGAMHVAGALALAPICRNRPGCNGAERACPFALPGPYSPQQQAAEQVPS